MSTVKFNAHKKLKKLQSKILLETDIELTQQEILELAVSILTEDIKLVINRINRGSKIHSPDTVDKMVNKFSSNWGKGSKDSATSIDEELYK